MKPTTQPTPPLDPLVVDDPKLADRVRGLVPVVRSLIGKVRAVGIVSAVAAVALWAVLFGDAAWPPSVKTLGALLALGALLIPAAGTFLAVGTLGEVLGLPARLRSLPGAVRESASGMAEQAAAPAKGRGRAGRLVGVFGVLWQLRGVVLSARGSWLRTLALARFARLASLPFALGMVVAFALNFAVIAAAIVALIGLAL